MSGGNIILLNGTSSAGKTTIAQAIQEVMEAPYLHTGIDQFLIEHLPRRLLVYSDGVDPPEAEGWLAVSTTMHWPRCGLGHWATTTWQACTGPSPRLQGRAST